MNVESELARLREFWARDRELHEMSYQQQDHSRWSERLRLIEWANTIPIEDPGTLEEAVIQAYAHIVRYCEAHDVNPSWETFIQPPEVDYMEGAGKWRVCFESGPYEWAVGDSLGSGQIVPASVASGSWWFTEPHYSFDLVFIPE